MISSVSFHPFISHFPTALFVAGLILLILASKNGRKDLAQAASLNFSLGFMAVLMAAFSGMISVDVGLRSDAEVFRHQTWSFVYATLYGFCTVYSYTGPHSRTAWTYYSLTLIALSVSVFTGYQLVFQFTG